MGYDVEKVGLQMGYQIQYFGHKNLIFNKLK